MHIPKNYFHDKSVLALLGVNAAFLVLMLVVVLQIDTDLRGSIGIINYRSLDGFQRSGSTSDLYQFGIFALIVTFVSLLLSLKLYSLRKHLAVSVLGLNVVAVVFALIVLRALLGTS